MGTNDVVSKNGCPTAKSSLQEVRNLLTEDTWTQGEYARDKHRHPAPPRSPSACEWSLEGALMKVSGGRSEGYYRARRAISDSFGAEWLVVCSWNDMPGQTLASVHRILDAAIAEQG